MNKDNEQLKKHGNIASRYRSCYKAYQKMLTTAS